MKKIVSIILVFALMIQFTGVASASTVSKELEKELIAMNLRKEKSLELIKSQLEEQNMMEHFYIYETMINEEFMLIDNSIRQKYTTSSSTLRSDFYDESLPHGGELTYDIVHGGSHLAKCSKQFFAINETNEIINAYARGWIPTWEDLLSYVVTTFPFIFISAPAVATVIFINGGSTLLSGIFTNDLIDRIESGSGASQIIVVEDLQGGCSKVWTLWDDYPTISVPTESNYNADNVNLVKYSLK